MSIEAMTMVLHHSRAKGTAKLVLLGIANHQGDGGAWPSVSTLARYANVNERNVQRAIEGLLSKGELRREVQNGGTHTMPDHRRPNRYDVLVSCPPWCDRSSQHRDTRGPQLGLWREGVADTPPGGARAGGGVARTPPVPVAVPPPEPSLELPPPRLGTAPQHAREQDDRPCQDCGKRKFQCIQSQQRWPADDRHPYRPGGRP